MIRLIVATVALAFALPAQAQEMWSHAASGVSVPRQIGDMRLRDERDNSGGARTDISMQFGSADTVVTFYVYRPPYPNVALWFERARIAMGSTVGSDGVTVAPRPFTFGGAPAPNGLREELNVPEGNDMRVRSTAVAMAQVGEWLVKLRVSSRTLDRAGAGAVMDQLLRAVRIESPPAMVLPLRVPAACPDPNRLDGNAQRRPNPEAVAAAAVHGVALYAEARGSGGLAAEPDGWCRDATRLPIAYGTVYRRRNGAGWVALLGDAAFAISAERFQRVGQADAAVFTSTSAITQVAGLYESLPHPDAAVNSALPILVGRAPGLAEIRLEPDQTASDGKD